MNGSIQFLILFWRYDLSWGGGDSSLVKKRVFRGLPFLFGSSLDIRMLLTAVLSSDKYFLSNLSWFSQWNHLISNLKSIRKSQTRVERLPHLSYESSANSAKIVLLASPCCLGFYHIISHMWTRSHHLQQELEIENPLASSGMTRWRKLRSTCQASFVKKKPRRRNGSRYRRQPWPFRT